METSKKHTAHGRSDVSASEWTESEQELLVFVDGQPAVQFPTENVTLRQHTTHTSVVCIALQAQLCKGKSSPNWDCAECCCFSAGVFTYPTSLPPQTCPREREIFHSGETQRCGGRERRKSKRIAVYKTPRQLRVTLYSPAHYTILTACPCRPGPMRAPVFKPGLEGNK